MVYGEHILKLHPQEQSYALRLYHSTVPAGKRTYWEHHHTQFEISLLQSGSGIYMIGGKAVEIEKDDLIVLSGEEIHCITEISPEESFDLLNIQFDPRIIWSEDDAHSKASLLNIFLDRNEYFENRLPRKTPAAKKIKDLILQMEKEFSESKYNHALMIKLLFFEVLLLMSREFGFTNNSEAESYASQNFKEIEKSMNYIDDNLCSDLTLGGIAELCTMNRTYFSTVFKRFNGISPWEYITIKRVEKAIELIKSSNKTVLNIAMLCGFNNTANFYRAFKKVTGKTPSDFISKQT